jgi:hypothetical protein
MGWNIHSDRLYCSCLMLVLIVGLGLSACTTVPKPHPPEENLVHRESELKAWKEGMQAFDDGDYEKAWVVFEVLTESAETESMRSNAFFALASTRLVLAQTPEEFNEAMSVWACWSRQIPDEVREEDPRMLTPFLQRLTPPGAPETNLTKSRAPVKKIIVYNNPGGCKDLLQAKEKEVDRIKSRLETREREIRRLKHQIDSLEAIHLKFQERKQGASSP